MFNQRWWPELRHAIISRQLFKYLLEKIFVNGDTKPMYTSTAFEYFSICHLRKYKHFKVSIFTIILCWLFSKLLKFWIWNKFVLYLISGVTLRSPPRNMNMSEIDVMFTTGVGIRVHESNGLLSVMVSLPNNYNETDKVCDWSFLIILWYSRINYTIAMTIMMNMNRIGELNRQQLTATQCLVDVRLITVLSVCSVLSMDIDWMTWHRRIAHRYRTVLVIHKRPMKPDRSIMISVKDVCCCCCCIITNDWRFRATRSQSTVSIVISIRT